MSNGLKKSISVGGALWPRARSQISLPRLDEPTEERLTLGKALIQQHALMKQQQEQQQREAEAIKPLSTATVTSHPLTGGLGGRRRVSAYVRLARKTKLESAVDEVIADQELSGCLRQAEERSHRYMLQLQQLAALPVPPAGAEMRQVHLEGLAVAQLHNELAARPALDSAPELRRACLQRALAAVPPAPIGSKALAETLYSLGCFQLKHGTPAKAVRYLRRSVEAAEPEPSAASVGVSAKLNLCVALTRTNEHRAALDVAQQALETLQTLPAERIDVSDRAALEGIARYNLMCCHEAAGQHRSALTHARRAKQAVGHASLPADHALATALGAAEAAYRETHPAAEDYNSKLHAADTATTAAAQWKHHRTESAQLGASSRSAVEESLPPERLAYLERLAQPLARRLPERPKEAEKPAWEWPKKPPRSGSEAGLPYVGELKGAASGGKLRELRLSDSSPDIPTGRKGGAHKGGGAIVRPRRSRGGTRREMRRGSLVEGQASPEILALFGRGSVRTPKSGAQRLDAKFGDGSQLPLEQMVRLVRVQARVRGHVLRKRSGSDRAHSAAFAKATKVLRSWARRLYFRALTARAQRKARDDAARAAMETVTDPTEDDVAAEGDEGGGGALLMVSKMLGGGGSHNSMLQALRQTQNVSQLLDSLRSKRDTRPPPTMRRDYREIQGRAVRIFLSSTFRDMNAERAIFTKRYIPGLRQLAHERGVFVTFVDLRWGVTKGQASEGEVVKICLDQLSQSRYFVNFLGLRYGWRPNREDLKADTFEQYGHVIGSYCPGRSVTEFEVIYGACGWGPASVCPPTNAFFYIRADEWVENNIDVLEYDAFWDQDQMVQMRLNDLKRRIRARAKESETNHGQAISGARLPFVECCRDYEEPEEFAQMLYEDLVHAIKRDFPERRIKTPLDEQFLRHLSHASQHTRVYVGHDKVQARIDEYVQAAQPEGAERVPLVLVGGAGTGKTAALANWLLRAAAIDQEDGDSEGVEGFLLPHFCGSTSNSADHTAIVKRLAEELKRCFGFEGELPTDRNELIEIVPQWLSLACEKTRVTIIIDGLDRLSDPHSMSLSWLPSTLPSNCSVLLSTSKESAAFEAATALGWASDAVPMPKLTADDKQQVAIEMLQMNHKTLEPHLLILIGKAKQTAVPLFLHMVLEELMHSAVFETLQPLLQSCLAQPNALKLALLVLERLETQFGVALVRQTMCCIEASRFGVSESELLEVLGVNQTDFSPFFDAVRYMLCDQAGLLNFSSNVMQAAVVERYFRDDAAKRKIHTDLVAFFDSAAGETMSEARRNAELPYQLMHAHDHKRLTAFLLDMKHVRYLISDHRLDLEMYWLEASEGEPPDDLGTRYLASMTQYESVLRAEAAAAYGEHDNRKEEAYLDLLSRLCSQVGHFLSTLFQYEGALAMQERALEITHSLFDNMSERVAEDTRSLAKTLYLMGKYDEAMGKLHLSLGIYGHLCKHNPTARIEYAQTLVEMAGVARHTDAAGAALKQCQAALRTFKQMLGDTNPRLAPVLNRLACLCLQVGGISELERARAFAQQARLLCSQISEQSERLDATQAEATQLLGQIALQLGHADEAIEYLFEALSAVTKCQGTATLTCAEVCEDLALAILRKKHDPSPSPALAEELMAQTAAAQAVAEASALPAVAEASVLPDTDAAQPSGAPEAEAEAEASAVPRVKVIVDPSTSKRLRKLMGDEALEEPATAHRLLTSALAIRRKKNGPTHQRVAYCLLRHADYFWTQRRFSEVVATYKEVITMFEALHGTPHSKHIAQLSSWISLAHACQMEIAPAEEWNKKAELCVAKVFGASSWEMYRVMFDKARLCETAHAAVADLSVLEGSQLNDARKAYAKAERFDAQAKILLGTLMKTTVEDEARSDLSHFAPIMREAQHSQLTEESTSPKRERTSSTNASSPKPGRLSKASSFKEPSAGKGQPPSPARIKSKSSGDLTSERSSKASPPRNSTKG